LKYIWGTSDVSVGSPRAILTGSQALQNYPNKRTESLQRGERAVSASYRLMHRYKKQILFDHLIGA
jgi:hypothetical protein